MRLKNGEESLDKTVVREMITGGGVTDEACLMVVNCIT